jgi:type I restriction enzyme S subunit
MMCDMKKDWEVKKLGEILKLEYGKPLPDEKRVINGDFPVYGANGIKGRSNVFYSDKKTIIVGRKGSAGEINLTEEKFWPLDVTYFVTYDERKYDLLFLFHLLSLLNLHKLAKGVKPGINRNEVYNLEASIPPLPEQQRIVSMLDKCFIAINKAKSNAEQNLKNAKELFESYLQGVFENGKWEKKKLNEISENLDSKRIPITKNKRNSGNIPYYGASGIVDYVADYIFDDNLLCISEDGANLLARTYPIAFSITGKTWVNNHAHVLKFPNITIQKFVELYINSIKIDEYVSGMAQPKLNQAMLNKIPIPIPSLTEQQFIVRQLDSLKTQTQKLETVYNKKISDLEELKKSILQEAFRGQL